MIGTDDIRRYFVIRRMFVNIDKKKLMAGAKAAFENRLLEKVEFISTRCWPSNLENNLKDVNRLIEAATVLEVTSARQFKDDEIKVLVEILTPLRTLEMQEGTRSILTQAVLTLGIDQAILEAK